MKAVSLLVQGKTDTELLETIVACLIDNEEDLIKKLEDVKNYNQAASANLKVLAAIVRHVDARRGAVQGEPMPNGLQKCLFVIDNLDRGTVHIQAAGNENLVLCGEELAGLKYPIVAVPDCLACLDVLKKALGNVREAFSLPPFPKPAPDKAYQSALAAIATGTCREWLRRHGAEPAYIGEADLAVEVAKIALGEKA
jgi:hypothetical protein